MQRAGVFRPDRPEQQLLPVRQRDGALQLLGIRPDREAGSAAMRRRRHLDPGIQRQHAVLIREQRVDVELRHLVEIGGQLGDLDQGQRDLVQRRRRPIAIAVQQSAHPGPLDQLMGQVQIERRQGQRLVAHHLDRGAAVAEHQDRPEHRIVSEAHDQLEGVVGVDHALDRQAVDPSLGPTRLDIGQHGARGFVHGPGIGQAEHHAADVGLVGDVGRDDLERDRLAELGGRARRLVGRLHDHRLDHRHAVAGEDALGLDVAQPFAALGQRGREDRPGQAGIGREALRDRGRHLAQDRLVAPVADQMHERPHRLGGRLVARHALLGELGARRGRAAIAQPAGQDRPLVLLGSRDGRQGRLAAVGDRGRAVHDQDRIVGRIGQDRIEGPLVARAGRIADQIDRIRAAPELGQDLVELGQGRLAQFGQPAALGDQAVGGEHADAAAVGHDRQPVAMRVEAAGQGLDRGEQLVQAIDPEHAGAPDRGVVDRIGAGQRPGMGARGLGGGSAAAGLDHHHRLAPGGRARRRHELAGMADALDVEQDRPAAALGRQVVEQVADIDIGHAADREHVAEADPPVIRPIQHAGQDRPRLGDEGELAGQGIGLREAGIEAAARHHDAQAIGADDAHQGRPRGRQHRLLQPLALLAQLGEAGRDHDRRPGAAGRQRRDDAGHGRGRRRDHREVRHQRQSLDRGIGQDALDRSLMRVDRHDRAGKAGVEQIARDHRADRARLARGADQGDRARVQQDLEIADRHGGSAPGRWLAVRRVLVIEQDPLGSPVQIVELAALERPEKSSKAQEAEEQGDRDQIDEGVHGTAGRRARPSRRALPTTSKDEADMQRAATSGVTRPATASGMVSRL